MQRRAAQCRAKIRSNLFGGYHRVFTQEHNAAQCKAVQRMAWQRYAVTSSEVITVFLLYVKIIVVYYQTLKFKGNKMETLEIPAPKDRQILTKVDAEMYEEIQALVKKNNWNLSAFMRVAVRKELDRLKG